MRVKHILFIVLLGNCINIADSEMQCDSKLALHWPRTVCLRYMYKCGNTKKSKCKDDVKDSLNKNDGQYKRFTIHGLWDDGDDCNNNGPDFDLDEIENSEKLEQNMPNLIGNNTDLWEHEWNKHGNKTGLQIGEYFDTTLSLYDTYGDKATTALLEDCFSNDVKEMTMKNLSRCIMPNLTLEITVFKGFLSEIRICFNRTFHPIDCKPPKSLQNQHMQVKLPPSERIEKRSVGDVSIQRSDISDECPLIPVTTESTSRGNAIITRKLILLPLLLLRAHI